MPEARDVVKDLATKCDVIIENFRPGKMESWNLGPEDIRATNPDIIYTRISGYGQDGPYSPRPGYASVCEAVGGLRHINGFEGMPPVRPNISLGDSLAGVHAALGVVMSLLNRDGPKGTGKGQIVDVAIYETMFNMMEGIVPEFDGANMIRGPSGSTITGITPTNTYVTKEGAYVVIGGNGDSIYKRLMTECGRPDLANDPMLSNNALRNKQEKEIDEAIQAYTSLHTSEHILERMRACGVPAGPVYSVQDMFEDPHFIARGMLEQVHITQTGKDLKIPAIVPKLTETPGGTRFPGCEIGSYTDEVLAEVAGFSAEKIAGLREKGALAVRRPRTK
jgi:crotonobetainyl-CoA:carnitine CoA-transferase CaiB-like acyl-CoA transferase